MLSSPVKNQVANQIVTTMPLKFPTHVCDVMFDEVQYPILCKESLTVFIIKIQGIISPQVLDCSIEVILDIVQEQFQGT